jgi:hypothetical protein
MTQYATMRSVCLATRDPQRAGSMPRVWRVALLAGAGLVLAMAAAACCMHSNMYLVAKQDTATVSKHHDWELGGPWTRRPGMLYRPQFQSWCMASRKRRLIRFICAMLLVFGDSNSGG